jgi:hypothetical protein
VPGQKVEPGNPGRYQRKPEDRPGTEHDYTSELSRFLGTQVSGNRENYQSQRYASPEQDNNCKEMNRVCDHAAIMAQSLPDLYGK